MNRGAMTSEMMEFTNNNFIDYTYNYINYTKSIKGKNTVIYSALDHSFLRVDGANYFKNVTDGGEI
jgi:hypothetical protein